MKWLTDPENGYLTTEFNGIEAYVLPANEENHFAKVVLRRGMTGTLVPEPFDNVLQAQTFVSGYFGLN